MISDCMVCTTVHALTTTIQVDPRNIYFLGVHIVIQAIEDSDPSDGGISLEECVVQALTVWWLSTNRPAIWKSEKIRQGFVKLHMPGIYACLIKRHPTLDPTPPEPRPQNGPQPGTSGQMSTRPEKCLSLESVVLKLTSTAYDFLRKLSCLIQTPENAYGIVCMTNLPDEAFLYIRQEHTQFPEVVDRNLRDNRTPNKIQMGTKF